MTSKIKKKRSSQYLILFAAVLLIGLFSGATSAQNKNTDAGELASKLTNPVADMISVPFQYNYDANIGADKKGTSNSLVVQPVVPIKLNSNWNYIVRPVVTLQSLSNVNGYSGS